RCCSRASIRDQLDDPAPVDLHSRLAPGLVMHPFGDIAIRVGLRQLATSSIISGGGGPLQRVSRRSDFIQFRIRACGDAAGGANDLDHPAALVVLIAGDATDSVHNFGELACSIVAELSLTVARILSANDTPEFVIPVAGCPDTGNVFSNHTTSGVVVDRGDVAGGVG